MQSQNYDKLQDTISLGRQGTFICTKYY